MAVQGSNILLVYSIDGRLLVRLHVAGANAVHKPIHVAGQRPRQTEDMSQVQATVQGMAATGKYSATQLMTHVKKEQQKNDVKWA